MTTPEELERQGWQALSTGPEQATAFYREVLDDEVRMLFPGGLMLTDREQVIESMGGPPWDSHELSEVSVVQPHPDVAVITYRVAAERGGAAYSALAASLYVRRDSRWRMVSHQHTPQ